MKDSQIVAAIVSMVETNEWQPELGVDRKSIQRTKRREGLGVAAQGLQQALQYKIQEYEEFENGSVNVTVIGARTLAVEMKYSSEYKHLNLMDPEIMANVYYEVQYFAKRGYKFHDDFYPNAEVVADAILKKALTFARRRDAPDECEGNRNDKQIEAAIDQLLETQEQDARTIEKVKSIIDSGVDIFITQVGKSVPAIVYNSGSKGKSAEESVITDAAYNALAKKIASSRGYLSGAPSRGEGADVMADFVSDTLSQFEFFSPSSWQRLTKELFEEAVSSLTTDIVLVTDHNGSSVKRLQ